VPELLLAGHDAPASPDDASTAPVVSFLDGDRTLHDQYTEIAALAGGLAHEIKNPLSTIRLNMELLAEEFADPDDPKQRRARQRIDRVQRECQRLEDLLKSFLEFARVRRLNLLPADLNQLVGEILEFYRPQAAAGRIDLVTFLDPDLPPVRIDREPLRAAILNLILNAQQAMPDGGRLMVRTRTTSKGAALDLIDTGTGIDPATLGRVFEAFYSTKRGGTGLGLPTTRKIIEAHDGRIYAQSAVGRGTQFTIELPTPARLESSDPAGPPVIELP
jgi:signal transduction histidine kinase